LHNAILEAFMPAKEKAAETHFQNPMTPIVEFTEVSGPPLGNALAGLAESNSGNLQFGFDTASIFREGVGTDGTKY